MSDVSALEARVLSIVADHLGVAEDDLQPEISLTDDLAVDSLDLVEIALALEAEFGIVIPQRLLDGVRTCADLVHATLVRSFERRAHRSLATEQLPVRARIATPHGTLERVIFLNPYGMETIAEDTAHWGAEASLDILVPHGTSGALVADIWERFVDARARGVRVDVRRDHRSSAA
jgi:acyl carrier protein